MVLHDVKVWKKDNFLGKNFNLQIRIFFQKKISCLLNIFFPKKFNLLLTLF